MPKQAYEKNTHVQRGTRIQSMLHSKAVTLTKCHSQKELHWQETASERYSTQAIVLYNIIYMRKSILYINRNKFSVIYNWRDTIYNIYY